MRPSRTADRPGRGKRANIYQAITPEEWQAVWRAQGGLCGICKDPVQNRYADVPTESKIAYCDHSHRIEKERGLRASIRGLLCLYCNRHLLVALHDSAVKAQAVADYLLDPPAQRVLCGK